MQKKKDTQDAYLKEFSKPVISNKDFVSRSSECSQNIQINKDIPTISSENTEESGWTINGRYFSVPNQSPKASSKLIKSGRLFNSREHSQDVQSNKDNPTESSENTIGSGWTINGRYFSVPNPSPKESSNPVKSDRLFKSREHSQDVQSYKDNPTESSKNTEKDGWLINGYFFKKPNQSSKNSAKPVKRSKDDPSETSKEVKARGWTINGQHISSKGDPKSPVNEKPKVLFVTKNNHLFL